MTQAGGYPVGYNYWSRPTDFFQSVFANAVLYLCTGCYKSLPINSWLSLRSTDLPAGFLGLFSSTDMTNLCAMIRVFETPPELSDAVLRSQSQSQCGPTSDTDAGIMNRKTKVWNGYVRYVKQTEV